MDAGCDWIYSFPRLHLIDFGPAATGKSAMDYDPGEAIRRELKEKERAEEVAALRAEFDRAYEENVRRAQHEPLPVTVSAYRDVFGRLPQGWPHASK